jgi:hypothetical protein
MMSELARCVVCDGVDLPRGSQEDLAGWSGADGL